MQNRNITPFKVTDVGTNQKHVCNFLLVINTDILSRTVSKLLHIVFQILHKNGHFAFLSPLWGIRGTAHCSF